jgi:hypothetical protein
MCSPPEDYDYDEWPCVPCENNPGTTEPSSPISSGYEIKSDVLQETKEGCETLAGGCTNTITRSGKNTIQLSDPDTEEDALDRADETEGTSCSSLYQLRTTSFSLTQRESKYTLKFTNLSRGRSYVACARLRRRKAFSGTIPEGEDTDWEDVEPDTFGPFQATDSNTEDGVTTVEEATDIDLPFEQGWEYEIVAAYVWPAGTPCECPTTYEPEEG